MAAVEVVRVIAGMGSAAVWVGGTVVGVVVALTAFLGVVLVWVLMAKTPAEGEYRRGVLHMFLQFLLDLVRGWGKR